MPTSLFHVMERQSAIRHDYGGSPMSPSTGRRRYACPCERSAPLDNLGVKFLVACTDSRYDVPFAGTESMKGNWQSGAVPCLDDHRRATSAGSQERGDSLRTAPGSREFSAHGLTRSWNERLCPLGGRGTRPWSPQYRARGGLEVVSTLGRGRHDPAVVPGWPLSPPGAMWTSGSAPECSPDELVTRRDRDT